MRQVVLVIKDDSALLDISSLSAWAKTVGFEIKLVCKDLLSLIDRKLKTPIDLLIIETKVAEYDDYLLLKKIIDQDICKHIALCSREGSFASARRGIQLGVDEYFTLPFDEAEIKYFLIRINESSLSVQEKIEENALRIFSLLEERRDISDTLRRLYKDDILSAVLNRTVEIIFAKKDWLDLYVNESDFLFDETVDESEYRTRFQHFCDDYLSLEPPDSEELKSLITHILYNPDGDLRQITLAEKLRLNKSHISTLFTAKMGIRYIDYVSKVKLMRAAWLLKNTNLRISDIATRLYYKDIAYFSKQFKRFFGLAPSEYRIPDKYQFNI